MAFVKENTGRETKELGIADAVGKCSLVGCFNPFNLVIRADSTSMHIIRQAWKLKLLFPPPRFEIVSLGFLEEGVNAKRVESKGLITLTDVVLLAIITLSSNHSDNKVHPSNIKTALKSFYKEQDLTYIDYELKSIFAELQLQNVLNKSPDGTYTLATGEEEDGGKVGQKRSLLSPPHCKRLHKIRSLKTSRSFRGHDVHSSGSLLATCCIFYLSLGLKHAATASKKDEGSCYNLDDLSHSLSEELSNIKTRVSHLQKTWLS
ncbi:hypothetical protein Ciccas_005675 [Cichlidogyrus casuarinus]|uniref:Uncharacterized protein n=1 Tax=Cichlidogyrus casuarinus TaxID=1844966 RepID=A0ABD2Q807_9PLAT